MRHYVIKVDGSSNGKGRVFCAKDLIGNDLIGLDVGFFSQEDRKFLVITCDPSEKDHKKQVVLCHA